MERLFRFSTAKIALSPSRLLPRYLAMSPSSGGSILIMSAPWSDKTMPVIGPDTVVVSSRILKLLSGPANLVPLVFGLDVFREHT